MSAPPESGKARRGSENPYLLSRGSHRRLRGRLDLAVTLAGLLLVVNLVAVIGLASARRDARAAIRQQWELETRTDARTFEALLAQQHADLSFLAQSPPLAAAGTREVRGQDPVARRWARLDLEASLLLFLESHPAVRHLEVAAESGAEEEIQAVAARPPGEVLQLAPPETSPPHDPRLVFAEWPLEDGGRLAAWIDPAPLLATAGPGLVLYRRAPVADRASPGPVEKVASSLWSPAFEGWIERRESAPGVASAVERLADRFSLTLLLNGILIPLSLGLGFLTLRRVRRLARLETEQRQQERLRELERQVQHAERLASLGRFAAGIAHEINNPLEGMANYLQLLQDDLEHQRLPDARRWAGRLQEGIDRAAGTVHQVLRFAQPGGGDHRPIDLAELVERTIDFLGGHPDCRQVVVRSRCPRLEIHGDPQTLGQLLLNLMLNACQAQPEGGEVEILARRLEDGSAEVRVLDRGPGFTPAAVDRLFEPFHSTRGSLGLGLAVCLGIVLGHGGRIEARNRRDEPGAEVVVWLPAAAGQAGGAVA